MSVGDYHDGGTQRRVFRGSEKPFDLVMCYPLSVAQSTTGHRFESVQVAAEAVCQAEQSAKGSAIMNSPSVLEWYRILQAHHQWTVFQAIRYALWLAR